MKTGTHLTVLMVALGVLFGTTVPTAYALKDYKWRDGAVAMHLQLGSSGALLDGSSSWNASAEDALSIWNRYVDRIQFTVVRDSTAAIGDGNRINNVFWSTRVYSKDFDDHVLAITTSWFSGSQRTEADVIFNTKYSFNAYRGPLRSQSNAYGGWLHDFHRVALHEFGHVLGLLHPDDFGQHVAAIMNAGESDLDHLAADDISGAQALYSLAGNGSVTFPPRNESLDFRTQLESKYRDQLRRPATLTYVDAEGDVVWTSEYLRYRVNQCANSSAVFRVMNQIDGNGTLGVCGFASTGQVTFPPRNESLDFRLQLEAKYRDELRRVPSSTSVDREGDVVWTQEYLRYRVNGCAHADAVQRVFLQIDGRGVQPLCR